MRFAESHLGMTRDLLQGTQARRLVRKEQSWTLEVECLVRRYGSVYRPSLRRIQGMDVILHHLHAVRAERLAEHARQLMDTIQQTTEEHSFEPVNDEWIPSSLLKTIPPAFDADDPKLAEKLAALDRENRDLKNRLAALEMKLADGGGDDAGLGAEDDEAMQAAAKPLPRRLSNAPAANEQQNSRSPLAYQGTMVLPNGRPDLRKPIPLEPLESTGDADEESAANADFAEYGTDGDADAGDSADFAQYDAPGDEGDAGSDAAAGAEASDAQAADAPDAGEAQKDFAQYDPMEGLEGDDVGESQGDADAGDSADAASARDVDAQAPTSDEAAAASDNDALAPGEASDLDVY